MLSNETKNAAEIIFHGGVVLIPTDTNYALAADPWNEDACARLYGVKERDERKPLTLFIDHLDDLFNFVDLASVDERLLKDIVAKYWPGPLNIILPKSGKAPANRFFDSNTISVVCNQAQSLNEIIRAVGRPLGLTSANISGVVSDGLVDYNLAVLEFGDKIDFAVPPPKILPKTQKSSTIIAIMNDQIRVIRQGDIVI